MFATKSFISVHSCRESFSPNIFVYRTHALAMMAASNAAPSSMPGLVCFCEAISAASTSRFSCACDPSCQPQSAISLGTYMSKIGYYALDLDRIFLSPIGYSESLHRFRAWVVLGLSTPIANFICSEKANNERTGT